MEQQKMERVMALAFVFIGVAFLMLLLSFVNVFPFTIATIFIVLATVISIITGFVIYRDSKE